MLVLAALLSVAHGLATPAFWPVDETSHVAYADHLVRNLELPRIDDPIPADLPYPGLSERLGWERDQLRDGRQDIWTSNHPPLPYVVQGVALVVGDTLGGGTLAVLLARLTSVPWLLLGVWATMQLAFLLAPRSVPGGHDRLQPEDVAVAAGTIVAVTGTLSHLGGLVFNDVPAFAMSTLCLYLGARVAFAGLDPRRLTQLGLLAGAASLTRISCLPAVGVMVLLAAYGWWRDPAALRVPGRARAVAVGAAAMVPAAAFWLRNIVLYGDMTAAGELLQKFDRDVNAPVLSLLTDRFFWLRLWNRMLEDLTTGHWAVGLRAALTEIVLIAVLVGLGFAVWGWVRAGRPLVLTDDRGSVDLTLVADDRRLSWHGLVAALRGRPRRVVWLLGSLLPLSLLASTVQFHAVGGSLHGRYVLGGHSLVATAMVLLLASMPRIGRWTAVVVAVPLFVVDVALVQALLRYRSETWAREGITLDLPLLAGGSTGPLVMMLLVAAGVALTAVVAGHRRGGRTAQGVTGVPAASSTHHATTAVSG